MTTGAWPRPARVALVVVPLAFLAVFFLYPVIAIVGRGLAPHWSVDFDPVGQVVTDAALRHIAWFTIWQATLSTVLTLAFGIPGAYVLARCEFPGRGLVRALVTVPFVLPTVVVGSAFVALLGDGGPLASLGLDQTLGAILIAHVFFNYSVVVRTVGSLWSHLDPRPEEAARLLGASRLRAFREVTLPALRPAIATAGAIVFLFTFTSFGVILILGGPGTATLETEIYRQTAQLLNLPLAAALTIVQLVAIVALLLATSWIEGRQRVALSLRAASETARRVRTTGARVFLAGNLAVMAVLLGVPVAVLVVRSFDTPTGLGLDYYRALGEVHAGSTLFVEPAHAIANSLRFAVAATAIAVAVGGCAAFALASSRRRGLDTLVSLPLGVSAVTVGFGFLIALDHPPFDLRGSWWLVPIAQALVAVPFVVRVMTPVLRAIDPRLRDAAATLGASPARVWREVDLPIVARAALVAAGFAFAISLGEFGATVFIVRPDQPTLPVLVYRLLGQPGPLNFGGAMAASVILMGLTMLAMLGIERFRAGTVGSF
ncbi:MAG TPA: iron ABC transporter permease [Acidimicrobiia bacterium]|jgi:thiamine transport system permease protein|nr:iron ABC transporter permease [Acidimicrobiia bacterium]